MDPGDSYAGQVVVAKSKLSGAPDRLDMVILWNGGRYPFALQVAKCGKPAPVFAAITPPPSTRSPQPAVVPSSAEPAEVARPDFVFFSQNEGGSIVADIVDSHGHHLADSLPKLHDLARYAEANGYLYDRIDAVSEVEGKYCVLNLKKPEVRAAIYSALRAKAAYQDPLATHCPRTEPAASESVHRSSGPKSFPTRPTRDPSTYPAEQSFASKFRISLMEVVVRLQHRNQLSSELIHKDKSIIR